MIFSQELAVAKPALLFDTCSVVAEISGAVPSGPSKVDSRCSQRRCTR